MNKKNGRRKTILIILTAGLLTIVSLAPNAVAADYSFQVDFMRTNVFINYNGSITIQYWINFTNNPYGKTIDWLDIGFPTKDYLLSSVSASIDGVSIPSYRIGKSSVIDIGVEVDLTGHYIYAGESAQLYIEGINPNMIYQDLENRSMGSLEFSPTWFDSKFCPQYEQLELNIYFPANQTNGNLVKYHYEQYTTADPNVVIGDNHYLVYTWLDTNVPMKQYYYGVSFPGDWVDTNLRWSANPRLVRIFTNILFWVCLAGIVVGIGVIIYRKTNVKTKKYYPPIKRTRPSGEAACVIACVALIGGIIFIRLIFWNLDIFLLLGYFAVVLAGIGMFGYLIYLLIKRTRKPYYKPRVMVESVGVKKGLTVVEAAIIRNTPLGKVVFLIVFSLIRTGHLRIVDVDPLNLEILGKERSKELTWYQDKFLDAITTTGKVDESKLEKLLIELIKKTQQKMKGHNLEATKRYYENMINQAWDTVRKLPKEIDWQQIEREYDWIILDDQFESRSERYLSSYYYSSYPYWYPYYYYHPYYWGIGHYARYHPSIRTAISPRSPPPSRINIHTFSDSVVRGIENMSNKIVRNFSGFAERIINSTRPIIRQQPSSRSGSGRTGGGSRGYSGGGCACACACACAGCACACAGGGR